MKEEMKLIKGITFSEALEMLKLGYKVAREGWNGKGMFLLYIKHYEVNADLPIWEENRGLEFSPLLPWIGMKTADNCFVPWLCSQTDMLAEDWCIVREGTKEEPKENYIPDHRSQNDSNERPARKEEGSAKVHGGGFVNRPSEFS